MHGLEVEVAGGGVVDVEGVGGVCVGVGVVGARHGGEPGSGSTPYAPSRYPQAVSLQIRPPSLGPIPRSPSSRSSRKASAVSLSSP